MFRAGFTGHYLTKNSERGDRISQITIEYPKNQNFFNFLLKNKDSAILDFL